MKFVTMMIIAGALMLLALPNASMAQVDSMKYEVVQTQPPLGTPPLPASGFCSTSGGALGCSNLQKYVRLTGTTGSGITGEWLSAGDDVAPLLAAFFDSIYAEFFDNSTYSIRAVDPTGASIIFAGTYTTAASGVGNIFTIVANQTAPSVVTSEGMYEIYTTNTGIEDDPVLLNSFVLKQNYPNPFNPATRIEFQLPERARVSLKVFNIAGQEVATILDEVRFAGSHAVEFQAGDLPSGIYFYRLNAGQYSQTRKMMLVR